MEAYTMMLKSVRSVLEDRMGMDGVEQLCAIVSYGLDDMKFMRRDIDRYGLSEEEIGAMLDSGFLQETEVSGAEARRISAWHRYNTDPSYRDRLERARQCIDHEAAADSRRDYLDNVRSRRKKVRESRSRRNKLMKEVLRPVFGITGSTGDGSLSTAKVLEACYDNGSLSEYYGGLSDPYHALRRDLIALGIRLNKSQSEGLSFAMSRSRMPMNKEKRLELLRSNVIVPVFGSPHDAKLKEVREYIISNGLRKEYRELCSNPDNLERNIREDLKRLRKLHSQG